MLYFKALRLDRSHNYAQKHNTQSPSILHTPHPAFPSTSPIPSMTSPHPMTATYFGPAMSPVLALKLKFQGMVRKAWRTSTAGTVQMWLGGRAGIAMTAMDGNTAAAWGRDGRA
jgi:hypothetical protein